jgi:uncharacterized membrane protein
MSRRKKSKKKTNVPAPVNKTAQPTPVLPPQEKLQSVLLQESFSGPLPKPEILTKYNEAVPNGAERIFVMAEKQSDHRQWLEKHALSGDSKRSYCGLFTGAFIALAVLGGGVWCILEGHDAAGATFISIDLVSIVSVFVIGGTRQRAERQQKAQIMAGGNRK